MEDYFEQLAEELKKDLGKKREQHNKDVLQSDQFLEGLKNLNDFSFDAIQCIRAIALYSTRASHIYENCLTVRSSDDVIQSIVGIRFLMVNGIHNMVRREIRYLLEMTAKYLVVDQEKTGKDIRVKTQYLNDNIPNSSIEVVDRLQTPFNIDIDREFKNEIKDTFYKACAFVHPSQAQIEEQLSNYNKGIHIGFETAKMLFSLNKALFRSLDMILTMLFIGFGPSMSGDLFNNVFDCNTKWKFHKGKYIKLYSELVR